MTFKESGSGEDTVSTVPVPTPMDPTPTGGTPHLGEGGEGGAGRSAGGRLKQVREIAGRPGGEGRVQVHVHGGAQTSSTHSRSEGVGSSNRYFRYRILCSRQQVGILPYPEWPYKSGSDGFSLER